MSDTKEDELTLSTMVKLTLVCLVLILGYTLLKRVILEAIAPERPRLPKMRKDLTVEELRKYNGKQGNGRVLIAVNGNIYDVTEGGFYGPGGPYSAFAGRDASRSLAKLSLSVIDGFDDWSDLTPDELNTVADWEFMLKEKYHCVGRLLKPGEQPSDYSNEAGVWTRNTSD